MNPYWNRIQKPFAYRAWRRRNPKEAAAIDARFEKEKATNEKEIPSQLPPGPRMGR